MSSGLLLSALLLGLAGVPHCLTMCAAPCEAVARRCSSGPEAFGTTTTALHLGRLTGYTLAGAVVAASVGAMASLSEHVAGLRPLWIMAQVGVVVFGLWLLVAGRLPGNWRVASGFGRASAAKRPATAYLLGVSWALLPCAQLYAGLMLAAMASGPSSGALVALAFALPGSAALWAGPRGWNALIARLRPPSHTARHVVVHWAAAGGGQIAAEGHREPASRPIAWDAVLIRLGGLTLAVSAGWMLWRSAQAGWQIVCVV